MCLNTICDDIKHVAAVVGASTAFVAVLFAAPAVARDSPDGGGASGTASVVVNDNRTPAGEAHEGVLRLHLRASRGAWRPEGETGRVLAVEAFGETGKPLQVPAPLIRVQQGTVIAGTIHNGLDSTLRVHGLCTRARTNAGRRVASPRSRLRHDGPRARSRGARPDEADVRRNGAFKVEDSCPP